MRVNHILLSHKTVGVLFSTVKENPDKIIRKYGSTPKVVDKYLL